MRTKVDKRGKNDAALRARHPRVLAKKLTELGLTCFDTDDVVADTYGAMAAAQRR